MSHVSTAKHQVCFVLEPFAGADENKRRENNLIFDEIIEPAVSGHGYRLVRSSELCRPDHVTREHQRLAGEEALVIANLSHADAVVHFTLAWRLAASKRLPVLAILRQDQEKVIETPVFPEAPVIYDLTPDRSQTDSNYSFEEQQDSVRRKLQLARRDLTSLVQQLILRERSEADRQAGAAGHAGPNPPPPPSGGPYSPAPPPNGGPEPGMVVDEIVRQLMVRLESERNRDIVDRLASTLLKT